MRIVTIGRGNIGGGLARLWREAGHDVTELGRNGGDASGADAVLVAVPGTTIAEALGRVTGLAGTVAIDATNAFTEREGEASYADQVKAVTGGPVSKAFNLNFASLFGTVKEQRVRPSQLYVGDEEAREVTEQLITDAGYDPVRVGDLSRARALEDSAWLLMGAQPTGRVLYRFAEPGEL